MIEKFSHWDNGNLSVIDEYGDLLKQHGLTTVEAFFRFPVDSEINCHKRRPVYRITLDGPEGERAFYLKRYAHPQLKNSAGSLLKGPGPLSLAGREWRAISALQKAGIPTMTPTACGQEFLLGIEKRSFLLTTEVPGLQPLHEYIETVKTTLSPKQFRIFKRKFIRHLGNLTRRMHESGIVHRDFYLKHVMLQGTAESFHLYILDLQRMEVKKRASRSDRARELAGLSASAPMNRFSQTDRLRFFHAYRDADSVQKKDRRLIDKINRRMKKLLGRKKFRQFQDPELQITWSRGEA